MFLIRRPTFSDVTLNFALAGMQSFLFRLLLFTQSLRWLSVIIKYTNNYRGEKPVLIMADNQGQNVFNGIIIKNYV